MSRQKVIYMDYKVAGGKARWIIAVLVKIYLNREKG
jgi:hypothetical protein